MSEAIHDRYKPSQQLKVNYDGSIDTNVVNGSTAVSSTNPLPVYLSTTMDIQIGAVEIKDGLTDIRAKVKSDGVDNAQVMVQNNQPLPTGAATSSKQDDMIAAIGSSSSSVVITKAISETGYDLNTAAFSETTNISSDFILDNIEFNFSTEEEKTITITSSEGTVIWSDTNTNTSVFLSNMNIGIKGGDNLTVDVTQFNSAGTMDCVLRVRNN